MLDIDIWRLYAVSPNFLMCMSSCSMFRIISRLICGVVLVRLAVNRQANLFRLFSFRVNILELICGLISSKHRLEIPVDLLMRSSWVSNIKNAMLTGRPSWYCP